MHSAFSFRSQDPVWGEIWFGATQTRDRATNRIRRPGAVYFQWRHNRGSCNGQGCNHLCSVTVRLDLQSAAQLAQAFLHSAKPYSRVSRQYQQGLLFGRNPSTRIFDFNS